MVYNIFDCTGLDHRGAANLCLEIGRFNKNLEKCNITFEAGPFQIMANIIWEDDFLTIGDEYKILKDSSNGWFLKSLKGYGNSVINKTNEESILSSYISYTLNSTNAFEALADHKELNKAFDKLNSKIDKFFIEQYARSAEFRAKYDFYKNSRATYLRSWLEDLILFVANMYDFFTEETHKNAVAYLECLSGENNE